MRFTKTHFSKIATTICLLPLLALTARGAQQGDFVYETNGGGAVVTAYVGPGGAVVIPGTLGGLPVKSIGDWGATAFKGLTNVTSVTIPNGVTDIGPYAFFKCIGLTNVSIPSSVTFIHYFAFDGCSGLTSLIIPNSITAIQQETFARCTSLTNVTLPNGLNHIGYNAFSGCTALTSIAIPNGVTTIYNAFDGCSSLTNITIPDSATYVGSFAGCTNLTAIEVSALNPTFSAVDGVLFNKAQTRLVACPGGKAGSYAVPNTVTNIGQNAFADCTLLTNVAIPSSVTLIEYPLPFSRCTGLTAIEVEALNPKFSSVDGVLFNKSKTKIIICPGGKTGNYVIPNSVTFLGWGAFDGCIRLTSAIIPNSVTGVDHYTFQGCTGLTNVSIPNSLSRLSDFMFRGCTSLTSITIPNSVTYFWEGVFQGCTGLKNVTIPNSVTAIDGSVFQGCTGLTNVTILNGVPRIGESMFQGCTSLTSIVVPNSVTLVGAFAFDDCAGLKSVVIPSSGSLIGEHAFADCTSLTGVYFEGNTPSLYGVDEEPTLFDRSPFVTVFYRSGTTGWRAAFADAPTALWVDRPSYTDWAASTGLLAQFPAAAGEGDDADGDGLTNGAKWFADTDPTQSASRLELELGPHSADFTAVYFRSVPGRYYGVESTTNLSGAWTLQAVRIVSTTRTRFVLPAGGSQVFYRVLALP